MTHSLLSIYNGLKYFLDRRVWKCRLPKERVFRVNEQRTPPTSSPRPRFSRALLGKFLILALSLALVACAGATTAQKQNASSTARATATSTQVTNAVDIERVTQPPAAHSVRVDVTLMEYKIIPSITVFRPGIPYYFVVTNKGTVLHEFTVEPITNDIYYQYNHMLIDLDTVPPGDTQMINYTFKTSQLGTFEIACHMRGHYQAGMHVNITVAN